MLDRHASLSLDCSDRAHRVWESGVPVSCSAGDDGCAKTRCSGQDTIDVLEWPALREGDDYVLVAVGWQQSTELADWTTEHFDCGSFGRGG